MTLVDDFRHILNSHNKAMCNYKKKQKSITKTSTEETKRN